MSILTRYRLVLGLFIVGLVLSGVTAFPLRWEMDLIDRAMGEHSIWVRTIAAGLRDADIRYPWFAYGTDWLAFAHLAIAVFFIGPLVDPARNVWVLWAGVICCGGVLPVAFIAGAVRGIPWWHQLVDCSFGILGVLPLLYCIHMTSQIQTSKTAHPA
ncbi:MAG: hypothetical protein QM770_12965 [Tepidisphaeraceae bacterium]